MDVLPQNSTSIYQKQIQQTPQQNKVLIDKHGTKCRLQINPTPPQLKAKFKIHKEDIPMRPVVNHINSPAYKIAKFLRKNLSAFCWFFFDTHYKARDFKFSLNAQLASYLAKNLASQSRDAHTTSSAIAVLFVWFL